MEREETREGRRGLVPMEGRDGANVVCCLLRAMSNPLWVKDPHIFQNGVSGSGMAKFGAVVE